MYSFVKDSTFFNFFWQYEFSCKIDTTYVEMLGNLRISVAENLKYLLHVPSIHGL